MNRLNSDARLPQAGSDPALLRRLGELHRDNAALVNAIAEGRAASRVNAVAAAPATGSFAPGDFVANSNPVELGAAGSKYVVEGWFYLSTGFVQKRFFTGN